MNGFQIAGLVAVLFLASLAVLFVLVGSAGSELIVALGAVAAAWIVDSDEDDTGEDDTEV